MPRKKKAPVVLDLRTVNPQGRLDVLAANVLEQFAVAKCPELIPLINEQREVIHASLNEHLGPHVLDAKGMIERAKPFLPLAGAAVEFLKLRATQTAKAGAQ